MSETISIGHLDGIESPWGPAGGVCKTVSDVEAMARTGVGWIEDGSQTLEPRYGNAVHPEHPERGEQFPVYVHNRETGETTNALGMPGAGIDIWEEEIPEKRLIAERYGKKLVQNVAPVSDEPLEESRELIARSYAMGAHAVLLNCSCPNVKSADGLSHSILSLNPRELGRVLFGLQDIVEQYRPIFVRISPVKDLRQMFQTARVIRESAVVSAVFDPNTWPGYVPIDEKGNEVPLGYFKGAGGRSGPAVANRAAEQTRWAVAAFKGSGIDVVRSAGITSAAELQRSLRDGAVAGAGTTFFRESLDWKRDTDKLLEELAA